MANKDDYLTEYRQFFEEFANTVEPNDQLPVKLGSYKFINSEVVGGIVDWCLQYLNRKSCPSTLVGPLIKITIEEIRMACRKHPINCGFNPSENVYEPLKLMQTVMSKVNEVCLRFLDNSQLDTLPAPPTVAPPMVSECATRNTRRRMEDKHIIIHDINGIFNIPDTSPTSYYAIFDGHAGPDAASYSAAHLHQFLVESEFYPTDPERALKEAFLRTDEFFLEKSKIENFRSGTTAVCALLRPKEETLYVAWVGDSQALLVNRGKVLQIVKPHKPCREDEKDRIEANGGCVMFWGMWRVNGQLAVSRAIGNLKLKPYVTAEPDIVAVPLDGNEEFLIMACDGLWDFVSEDDAAIAVYNRIKENPGNIDSIAESLADLAKQEGSRDNISVIVIFLKDPSKIAKKLSSDWGWTSLQQPTVTMETGVDNTNINNSASNNAFDLFDVFQKRGTLDPFNSQPEFKPNGTDKKQSDMFCFDRPSNGKRSADEFDEEDDDFGPETDIDAVDEGLLSPASAKALIEDNGNEEKMDTLDVDFEVQRQQSSVFEPSREPREETPTPPADSVLDSSGVADNVAESEDSEDEWNYYKVDPEQKENAVPLPEPSNTVTDEIDAQTDEMSQLNPDAKEFVPVSPTRVAVSPTPFSRDLVEDSVIAQSPRRVVLPMDISVPSPAEFQLEAKQRPSELFDELKEEKAVQNQNGHQLSSQEIMQNLLNGKDVSEIEFHPQNFAKSANENYFGNNLIENQNETENSKENITPSEEPTESSLSPLKDEADFASFVPKPQDPMSMSFYQDKEEIGFSTNPFDLNKVQVLPDNVDEFIQPVELPVGSPDSPLCVPLSPSNSPMGDGFVPKSPVPNDVHTPDALSPAELMMSRSPLLEMPHSPLPEIESPVCGLKTPETTELVESSPSPLQVEESRSLLEIANSPVGDVSQSPVGEADKSPLEVSQLLVCEKKVEEFEMTRSPLEVAQSPAFEVAKSPFEVSESPVCEMARSPLETAQSPVCEMARSPLEVSESPVCEMARSPLEVSESPACEVARSPLEISESPVCEMARSPLEVAQSPVCETARSPLEVSQSPVCETARSPLEVSESPVCEVARSPLEVSESPACEMARSPLEVAESPVCEIARSPLETAQSPVCEMARSPLEISESPVCEMARSPLEVAESLVCEMARSPLEVARSPVCEMAKSPILEATQSSELISKSFAPVELTIDPICEIAKSPILDVHSPMDLASPVGPLSPKSPIPELTGLVSPDITASIKDENISVEISETPKSPIQELENEVKSAIMQERVVSPKSPVEEITSPQTIEQALSELVEQSVDLINQVNDDHQMKIDDPEESKLQELISDAIQDIVEHKPVLQINLQQDEMKIDVEKPITDVVNEASQVSNEAQDVVSDVLQSVSNEMNNIIDFNVSVAESEVPVEINSFLERSTLPEVTSPLSPTDLEEKFQTEPPESWKQNLEIKCETIKPEFPIHTITSPSEDSKGFDTPPPTPVVVAEEPELKRGSPELKELVEAVEKLETIVPEVKEKVATKTTTKPITKLSSTTKKPSPTSPSKPLPSKTTTPTARKTPTAPRTTSLSTPKSSTLKAKPTSTPTASPRTLTAKTTPKPRTPTTTPTTKPTAKPLTNGDVKPIAKPTLLKKTATTTTTTTTTSKSSSTGLASKLSSTKTASTRLSNVSAAKPSSATRMPLTARPASTITAPKPRPASLTAKTGASPAASTTKTAISRPSTTGTVKSTTSTAKPKPSVAPAAPKPRPPITRPAAKAPDTEKQIKDTANKQLSAARTTTSRSVSSTASSAAKTMATAAKKMETKNSMTSRTTRTTTTTLKPAAKKPYTKTAVTRPPPQQNGVVNVIQEITTTIVSDDPQLLKDNSPVDNIEIDNLKMEITAD